MIISLIAAMDKNRLIGRENGLPWYLPADFAHFKKVTMGKPVVMGRKTYESIGRPLPGRENIVISRSGFSAEGITSVDSIDAALNKVAEYDEVMVIGGANLYQQMIGQAQMMYLTHVDAECDGDAWFPEINLDEWRITEDVFHPADEKNNFSFNMTTYQRVDV